MPDFDSIQTSLDALGASTDAAEAHGTLCALLLGREDFSRWLSFTLDALPEAGDLLARGHLEKLRKLFDDERSSLNSEDLDFELLLPDDEQELALRLLGLAGWCRGFLYGLGVIGDNLLSKLSPEGNECLQDLLEISQLAHDEEQTEETETVFTELVEHVRLCAIFLQEEINPAMPSPPTQ